jgi:hypothetical protein
MDRSFSCVVGRRGAPGFAFFVLRWCALFFCGREEREETRGMLWRERGVLAMIALRLPKEKNDNANTGQKNWNGRKWPLSTKDERAQEIW